MRRHLATLAVVLAVVTPLAACGDGGDDENRTSVTTTTPQDPLDGRTFEAVSLEGETGRTLVPDVPLRFTFDDGEITVDTGCNRLTGTYELDLVTLVVEPGKGFEEACPTPALTDQELWIRDLLTGRPVFTPTPPHGLVITYERAKLTLEEPTDDADATLVGPTWTLDTITSGDGVGSVPAGVTATLTFADDGTYQVAAGCNTGSGGYSTPDADGAIVVTPPALTRRRCDDAAMEVEGTVAAVLDGEVGTSIDGDRLTLTAADGTGLGLLAG